MINRVNMIVSPWWELSLSDRDDNVTSMALCKNVGRSMWWSMLVFEVKI